MADEQKWPSFEWRNQVRNDPEVTNSQWRIADWIAENVDRRTGDAWQLPKSGGEPITQAALADLLNCSIRTVNAGLRQLETRGHLAKNGGARPEQQSRRADEQRHGDGGACRYRPILKSANEQPAEEGGTQKIAYPYAAGCVPPTQEIAYRVRRQLRTPNNIEDPLRTPKTLLKSTSLEAEFAEWYTVYPRHSARRTAQEAYKTARERGATHEELIQGARRYAAQRVGQDSQFTKSPARWLDGDCWADESETPGVRKTGPPGRLVNPPGITGGGYA